MSRENSPKRILSAFSTPMSSKLPKKSPDHEIQLAKALYVLKNKDFPSAQAAAKFFQVNARTLQRRVNGGKTNSTGHEMSQILSNAEENTLVRWIKRYTNSGAHITIELLKELAICVRAARVTHALYLRSPPPLPTRINNKWIQRFQKRHPEVAGMYGRQLEHIRKEGATYEHVKRWFDAVGEMLDEHKYDPANMWNMDESGFGISEEQAMKVLIHIDSTQKYKVVGGK
jgi:hypothetical protein